MGCLSFLFDLIGEIIESIFEAVIEGHVKLMQRIIPERGLPKGLHKALKVLVAIFTGLLQFSMLLSIFAFISDDADTRQAGKYLLFVPLGISAVQILLGSIVHRLSKP